MVIFTPIWWGALPAKLKGLIDRTFLPGFAFQYEEGKLMPKQLLKGRTARHRNGDGYTALVLPANARRSGITSVKE